MKTVLKHIASIHTGFFAKSIQHGEVVYLQAKHFDENGGIAKTLYPDLDFNNKLEKHLLKKGDVLFAAKGSRNFAVLFSAEFNAVASTSFFVIRLNNEKILPAYLVWFLNHPNTMAILKGQAKGSSIVSISKAVLSELEVPVPNIDKQELILNIACLRSKERSLKQQIKYLREKEIQSLLISAIK